MKRLVVLAALHLAGCATVGHDKQGCTPYPLESPAGWVVFVCPHPFALMGLTSGNTSYGATTQWSHGFTDQAAKEIYIQDGYQYVLSHELKHASGFAHW